MPEFSRTPVDQLDRPKKPRPNFPLTPHNSGKWQKRIRGKTFYFGNWAKRVNGKLVRVPGDGWQEALDLYNEQADDLHAGRTPRVKTDGLLLKDLCNVFLEAKRRKKAAGELGSRSLLDYRGTTDLLIASFGGNRLVEDLVAADFEKLRAEMAERWGPVHLSNAITRIKTVFKYGIDNGLISKPVLYGSEFKKPGKRIMRQERAKAGEKLFTAEQIGTMLDAARPTLKAMILLGVNAGFGNTDVATLPIIAIDLKRGWINFPRPKTGIDRRCPLWPETVAAIRAALDARPEPQDAADAGVAFLMEHGRSWHRETKTGRTDMVGQRFTLLLKKLKLHRKGVTFYALRHTFRTIADAARDRVAIDLIMGHTDPSMGGLYREGVENSRLKAVTDLVHTWLFGKKADA